MASFMFEVYVPEGSDLKNPGVTVHRIPSDVDVPTRATIKDYPGATYIGVWRALEPGKELQESDIVGVYLVQPTILSMNLMLAEASKSSRNPQDLANVERIRQAGPTEKWYKWVAEAAVVGFSNADKVQSKWDLVCAGTARYEVFTYAPVSDQRFHILAD